MFSVLIICRFNVGVNSDILFIIFIVVLCIERIVELKLKYFKLFFVVLYI